jgi:hypothetical protein
MELRYFLQNSTIEDYLTFSHLQDNPVITDLIRRYRVFIKLDDYEGEHKNYAEEWAENQDKIWELEKELIVLKHKERTAEYRRHKKAKYQ